MDEKLRILLCEDDENLGMLLREYLQAKGYSAELYPDGEAGFKAFLKNKYDLCVFDVMMPKKDGFTLAQEVRAANAEIPIIFLTAKTLKEDILEGFKIGADDYITKPFSPNVLVARVKANLAQYDRLKNTGKPEKAQIQMGNILLQQDSRRVFVDGTEVELKNKEYELLLFLMSNADIVFSRETLYERIWGYEAMGDNATVAVHINRLREKIEKNPSQPRYIQTVWGAGYRFRP